MKRFKIASIVAIITTFGTSAFADNNTYPNNYSVNEYHPDVSQHNSFFKPLRIGFGMDVGVPSGASIGVVVHPKLDWVNAEASFTYVLAPGGRLSVKLDPLALLPNVPVGLVADVQAGFNANGTIPGHSDLPGVGWDYVNLYGGLRLGKPNKFSWVIEAGPSYMHITTSNFQSLLNKVGSTSNLKVGNPSVDGWLAPTFSTGFQVVWDVQK